jgi:hypothetical protein
MKRRNLILILVVVLTCSLASVAQAQATRTWVSGVGDDVNPCSRTAPCKTYAGAISKTAAGGIISTLDPGGFGAVTITKSITIEGTGTLGHILHSGTNGVVINALSTDVVVLRDLSLHGGNTGLDGVRILQAAEVYIQNCNIQNTAGDGIDIAPSGAVTTTKVFVEKTSIKNNSTDGINILPSSTGTVRLVVDESFIGGNTGNGIEVGGNNNNAVVFNSRIHQNGTNGISVLNASSTASVEASSIAHNATGVNAGGGSTVRLSNCNIAANTVNGVTGTIIGFFNNTIAQNAGNNNVTSSVAQQ